MRLFIAEKPSLGKAIGTVIGIAKTDGKSIILKNGDRITWAFGHLLQQAEPDFYLPDDVPLSQKTGKKIWRKSDLPIVPRDWSLFAKDAEIKAHIKQINEWINESDMVVNLGDPDREGQSIIDEVLEVLNNKKPVQRLWVQDMTDDGIRKALNGMRDNSEYANLYDAAKGRSRADWLVGMNLTRAMTLANGNGLLSVGRVQSAVLSLIVDRDKTIEKFKPKDFYEIYALGGGVSAKYKSLDDMLDAEGYLTSKSHAQNIADSIKQVGAMTCTNVEKKSGRRQALLPFNMSELQKYGDKIGLTAQQTLDIAQDLYEKHKLTTYPRSDCQYMSENQHADAPRILSSLVGYDSAVKGADSSIKSKAFNDKEVTAHTAIIPTGKANTGGLNAKEQQLYDAIVLRYIAQFYQAEEFTKTTLHFAVNEHELIASGKVINAKGWTVLFDDSDDDKEVSFLPDVQKDQVITLDDVQMKTKTTTPPKHFTEGTLIDAMVNIAKYVTDESAKAKLKEKEGIGTDATRANIIETLKKREFVTIKGKFVISSTKGRQLCEVLPSDIRDPVTTAQWETRLTQVEKGEIELDTFLKEIETYTREKVKAVLSLAQNSVAGSAKAESESLGVCPKCGKGHIIEGQKAFGCSDWKAGCDFKIWREVAGKKLTKAMVKDLIKSRKTKKTEGFTSKAGKEFAAVLKLDDDNKVVFDFS